jgi:hypothetical protein
MIEVVQAFDRTPIANLDSNGAAALDRRSKPPTYLPVYPE